MHGQDNKDKNTGVLVHNSKDRFFFYLMRKAGAQPTHKKW